jgi:uncharacterized protein DUF5916/cellulose/xylan binding protein with CBM9 domain
VEITKSLLFILIWLCAVVPATAQTAPHKVVIPPEKSVPIRVARFDKPPVIDGKLDDEVWKQATIFKDFVQTKPGDNVAPSRETIAMMGYDSKFLYFGFHCFDEPNNVRATVAKRDEVFSDDNIRVFLDTFNDQRRAYVLGWNPLGIQEDGILTEGSGTDTSVDIVMESKGMLTDDGWTVEVAIPFKSLRYEAGKGKLWGFNVQRNFFRFNDEFDSWMPQSREIASQLGQQGHITGLEGISTERTLELIPSVTVSETGKRVAALPPGATGLDAGRFVNEPLDFDAGLTMKFGISPNLTLDLALNPDFAQVEADETVVTANQRFPIFFEEKRPFFLEGIDIFQTRHQVVHTRAIVDPDVAVKLTGKRGRNTFGFLAASDNAPGNFSTDEKTDPVNARFINKNAFIAVLRLKRDVGTASNIGLIATSYNFIEKHNQLFGIDGRLQVDPKTVASFEVIGTTSRRCFFQPEKPEHTPAPTEPCFVNGPTRNYYRQGNGFAYSGVWDYTGRNFGWLYQGTGQTQDYRADVGFTRRLNTNNHGAFVRFSNDADPKRKIISWRLQGGLSGNFDWQGHLQNWSAEPHLSLQLHRNTGIELAVGVGYERLFEQEFGARRTATQSGAFFGGPERSTYNRGIGFGFSTNPSQLIGGYFSINYNINDFDFDFGAGERYPRVSPAALVDPDAPLDPGPGRALEINTGFSLQPRNEFRLSLDYTKSRLRRNDTGLLAFDENIFSFRSTYQFTRFVFFRARADYDTLDSSVRGQLLFGYTPNPGTAFYVGYNDDISRNGFNPFTGQLEPGFRRNGRTFFVKVSYLIRKSFGG